MTLSTIVYPVRDLEAAKAVFTAFLGTPPTTDTPY
jgi:catechol 2,3-dioxygenase-like lactoylglutathione lyase family enzyme